MMNRTALLLSLILLIGGAAACSSAPVKDAYTASGDAADPADLTRTTTFQADDDLNVVVRLNAHSRTLPLQAVFVGPDGAEIATDTLGAKPAAGLALLGLDWEARGTNWLPGEWQVRVLVDHELHNTLRFTVQPGVEQTPPAGEG